MKARINPPKFESMGSAKYSRIMQVLNSAKQGLKDEEDFDVSIEFLLSGCYPDLWENFKKNINEQFNLGYEQGLKDAFMEKLKDTEPTIQTSGYIAVPPPESYPYHTITYASNTGEDIGLKEI